VELLRISIAAIVVMLLASCTQGPISDDMSPSQQYALLRDAHSFTVNRMVDAYDAGYIDRAELADFAVHANAADLLLDQFRRSIDDDEPFLHTDRLVVMLDTMRAQAEEVER
jgi:hypothetical protein